MYLSRQHREGVVSMRALSAVGILCGLFTAMAIRDKMAELPVRKSAEPPRKLTPWEKVERHLSAAERMSNDATDQNVGRIQGFFAERKGHAREFGEDVLSMSGKWAWVKSRLPFTDGDEHETFLRESFERHLFKGDELKELVEATVASYLSELEKIDNETLVAIRADLSDSELATSELGSVLSSDQSFRQAYARVVEAVVPVVERDMKLTGGREAAAFVGSEIGVAIASRILTAVAARLGVSGGILTTGAASGVATLGAGLVAAFVVDMALDWVLKKAGYDPAGDIASKVNETLDKVESLLVEGDGAASGLRQEFVRMKQARCSVRHEVMKRLVLEGGNP